MTAEPIIQLITGFIGSFCFAILFHLRGMRLVVSALGGLFSWAMYLLLGCVISSEALCYFLVAVSISLYSEIMARILRTPATPIITTSLIPLIPGSSLYYTMAYAFESDWLLFWDKGIHTLKLASALAIGIIGVTATVQLVMRTVHRKRKNSCCMKK